MELALDVGMDRPLDRLPVVSDQRVVEPEGDAAPGSRTCVTKQIAVPVLRAAVVLDLDDQAVAYDEVDATDGVDPHLGAHGQTQMPQPPAHERLQSALGVAPGERDRLARHRRRVLREPVQTRSTDLARVEG